MIESQSRRFIRLPNGQNMPIVGLGLWLANDSQQLENAIDHALSVGYRHFDTAAFYQNEEILGKTLRKWIDGGKVKREDLFIVTKLPWTGMTVDKVEFFMKLSLKKLQLNYVDLYLCHMPIGLKFVNENNFVPTDENGKVLWDTSTDIIAVWKEMEKLVDSGRAKAIGLSNYNERQVEKIMKNARIPPASLQVEIHAYFQNRSVVSCAEKHNISVVAYAPLGSPGRKAIDFQVVKFEIPNIIEDPVVLDIAKKHKKTAGQILLRFLLQQGIAVIPKSTNPDRIKQNLELFDFSLSNVDMRRLEGLDKGSDGRSFPGFPGQNAHPEAPWKHQLLTLPDGNKMPLVGLGMWQTDDATELEAAVDAALNAGYRHFDTATLYKNEDKLGNVLKKWLDSGKVKREELFIVTKLPWTGMAPERVELFLNSSLRKLQLDYIDLYLIHWPIGLKFRGEDDLVPMDGDKVLYDTTTDLEAIWKELEKHVESGKLKSIGISNFTEKQIERIMKVAKIPPANHQIEIHVYFQNRKLRDYSEKHGITLAAYGPLGSPGRDPKGFPGMSFEVPNLLNDPIFNFELSSVDMRRIEALDRGDKGRSFPGFPDMRIHKECPWLIS
ncbi:Prostaglandin F synthase 1 [Orchesella cincta]|uniref:Prostaglandin F synthase 1 n=1 Tax=Orchesella cincta TaxID=48709 RepID=A0A1D2MH56_ORCCI|nr:Prostaglandin F synthase 1 [Orchesella cincta]